MVIGELYCDPGHNAETVIGSELSPVPILYQQTDSFSKGFRKDLEQKWILNGIGKTRKRDGFPMTLCHANLNLFKIWKKKKRAQHLAAQFWRRVGSGQEKVSTDLWFKEALHNGMEDLF